MPDGRFAFDLLEACQSVHMHLTGASDPLNAFEERVAWLRARLSDWRPGAGRSWAFDEGVRSVLRAVLEEVERAELERAEEMRALLERYRGMLLDALGDKP